MAKIWKWLAIAALVALLGVSSGLGYSLARISGELGDTQANLVLTQDNLLSTQNELSDTLETLQDTQNDLRSTEDTLAATQLDLAEAITQLSESEALAADNAQRLADVQFLFDNLSQGYSYVANEVSYQDVIDFLASDTTDINAYNSTNYTCFNFTADVISNALGRYIWCGFVYVLFKDGAVAHALVAFETSDRGIVYFEPQTDDEVDLQIGKRYWSECLPPGLFSSPTSYDDTVESFVIIW